MTNLNRLQKARTITDLATILGYKPKSLAYIIYKIPEEKKYKEIKIPKKGGGIREIAAPEKELKLLQKKLNDVLIECREEIGCMHNASNGFEKNRNILLNAKVHRNKRFVLNIDLKDFFHSIHFGRIKGFFIKNENLRLDPKIAHYIAKIACHNGHLPQGSPCSPVISNFIADILDSRLAKLAWKNKCVYTRYADDITFSTNQKEFPGAIAIQFGPEPKLWKAGPDLQSEIERATFKINDKKTRMQHRYSRQTVTGLVVNKVINPSIDYRRTVRAMTHSLLTTGTFDIESTILNPDNTSETKKAKGNLNQLHGMLGFIDKIQQRNKTEAGIKSTSFEHLFKRFLYYKIFYAAKKPTLIVEGKTDYVYLLYAIRRLAAQYPQLAEIDAKGNINLKIKIHKNHRKSSTSRILGLYDGGTSPISNFIESYTKESKNFHEINDSSPTIVIIDNDSGAKPIRSIVKNKSAGKNKFENHMDFLKISDGFYITQTPLIGINPQSCMEDLFDSATLKKPLGPKTFCFDNDPSFDDKIHFGKNIFAEKIVRTHADTINFSGFKPLLDRIVKILTDHKSSSP